MPGTRKSTVSSRLYPKLRKLWPGRGTPLKSLSRIVFEAIRVPVIPTSACVFYADRNLEKSSKNWPEVNLNRISKYTGEKETALIPGKVLSTGELTKKVSIAAWSFSEKSQEKITKAGGKHMSIEELVKNNPKGKDIRILG